MPEEPPPTGWRFPPVPRRGAGEVVGIGADLEPGTLLTAYRTGVFPMPLDPHSDEPDGGPVAWWSPARRGIFALDGLHVSRSLRRSMRRYDVSVDAAFDDVVGGCGDPRRPHGWITPAIQAAYGRLHRLGWAHSVEVWTPQGRLVGGLYGLAIGGLFAAESKFSLATDASKVALVALVERLRDAGPDGRLLDVQWCSPHLASLGCVDVPRAEYRRLLRAALALELPYAFDDRRVPVRPGRDPEGSPIGGSSESPFPRGSGAPLPLATGDPSARAPGEPSAGGWGETSATGPGETSAEGWGETSADGSGEPSTSASEAR